MTSLGDLVFVLLFVTVMCFAQESITCAAKGEACNIIHVNCGAGQQSCSGQQGFRNQGTPGKMGPVGPIGPQGIKGEMGPRGVKGDRGRDANSEDIKQEILGMLGVTSCMELQRKYGVNKTGYYLMRVNGTATTANRNCHFKHYEDIYTCHALRQSRGIAESGHYFLGARGKPYEVQCKFGPLTATTEVWHDSMRQEQISEKCEGRGCYSRVPKYEVDEESITKIIENSTECRQFIKLRCVGVQLFRNNYGWWVSRGGERMSYWGGTTRSGYCGCGVTESCVNPSFKCNCDNNAGSRVTQDEGFLRDKTKLPVRELRFGDMGSPDEIAWHELGGLQCHG